MTRYTVDNLGEETFIKIRYEFPVSKEWVELPDDLPADVSVDITEEEPQKTVVTYSFPQGSDHGMSIQDFQDATDYNRPE